MASGKAVEQHWSSRTALGTTLDGSRSLAVPVTVRTARGRAAPGPIFAMGPGGDRIGYPVTVSDCVETGPAPSPGNADPTPLNITSLTVYRPGRRYTCVGVGPEPVVPSPNSHI